MELLSIVPLLAFVLMIVVVARNRPNMQTWAKLLLAIAVLVIVANVALALMVGEG